MARTIGLDIGTNSIGWALVEDKKKIIKSGVRVFPVGVQEEDFLKNGTEVSKNIARRMARGARRRRFRFKLRRKQLEKLLQKSGMLPDADEFFSTRELYELRVKGLNEKLSLTQFGRILLMLNKRRGFKSNRKTAADPKKKKEEGIVIEEISKLQQQIVDSGLRTLGEYFYSLFKKADKEKQWPNEHTPIERIRDRFVGRDMYEKEFEILWATQAKYYPKVLTPKLRTKIGSETIYYQRNLKSQKGLVGKCRFEPSKRCAQRSSLEFQEYRIWQQLWMVRFSTGDRIGQELTVEEKQKACTTLMKTGKLTEAKLKELLGVHKSEHFNDVFDLKGNRTNADLIRAFGEELFDSLKDTQRFEFWHILTYTDNTEKLKEIIRNKTAKGVLPKLSEEQLNAYAEINLEEGFSNLSKKALLKILPYLREGLPLTEAIEKANYSLTEKMVKGKVEELTKLPPLAPNELRNPIVQQMLSETFRVVNAIVKEYGKPDMMRVELAREIKKPKMIREEIRNNAIRKRKQREEYAEFLTKRFKPRRPFEPNSQEVKKYELWLEMGCKDPELDDLNSFMRNGRITDQLKYRLWKECGRISPYSGNVIPLSKLLSPEIQIDHILPYSQTMNNEFGNLCLCEADINKRKGDKLPYEYFESIGQLEKFKSNVARIQNEGKQKRFLAKEIPEDFLNSQLTNTSYAARELAWRLQQLLPPIKKGDKNNPRVQISNGQATSILRRHWALNSILSKGDIDTKNRGDHRHHAIDAITIACTTPALIQDLAKYSKFDDLGKLRNKEIKEPMERFLNKSEKALGEIIISYRNQKRLVGTKPNKIKTKNLDKYPKGYILQNAKTIRGTMHEETLYGSIKLQEEQQFVTRWPLTKFTEENQLDKVVDPKVREVLKKRVEKYGDIKKAFEPNEKDLVLMYSKKGVIIPIRHVRVINPGEHLEEVRPGVFVEPGNNYAIAIYEDTETKKRAFETISFYSAVQRSLHNEPIVKEKMDSKPLLFVLKQRDIVVKYDKGPDEIDWDDMDYLRSRLFRVRKFDVKGIIYIDYLYAAKINDKEDRNRLFFQLRPNTMNFVRVEINALGKIVRKEGV
ncbi:MAG: type II CRISPR RNA-guided endonuclease Cas9 [Bacteroidota bacterium]|jgi:CRISPR-associated endonuclease Csn1